MHKDLVRIVKKKILKNKREITLANEISKIIKKEVTKNSVIKILDFGCGKNPVVSIYLYEYLKKKYKIKFYLFDKLGVLNPDKKKFFIVNQLVYKDNFFDYMIINDVIHHFKEYKYKKSLKRKLSNILKISKRIIIKDHFQNNQFDNFVLKVMDRLSNLNKVNFPDEYFSRKKFQNLLKSLNYKIIYLKNISIYNLIYPFSKKSLQFICLIKKND